MFQGDYASVMARGVRNCEDITVKWCELMALNLQVSWRGVIIINGSSIDY